MTVASNTFLQAQDHLRAGRLEQARSLLVRASGKSPADPQIATLLSDTLTRLGQHEQALYYAQRAAAAAHGHPGASWPLANALWNCGRGEEAIALAQRTVDEHPTHIAARGT